MRFYNASRIDMDFVICRKITNVYYWPYIRKSLLFLLYIYICLYNQPKYSTFIYIYIAFISCHFIISTLLTNISAIFLFLLLLLVLLLLLLLFLFEYYSFGLHFSRFFRYVDSRRDMFTFSIIARNCVSRDVSNTTQCEHQEFTTSV